MIDIADSIFTCYGSEQAALESMCDALVVEDAYFNLFAEEQQSAHDWIFSNADEYADGEGIDWVGAFYDWIELS